MTEIFKAPLILRLAGPVTLLRADGSALTPSAAKQRALLVLIATGQGMRRSRAFLQDKLWSEASPAKGAASLRQALSSLRRELDDAAAALISDGNSVGLDPKRLHVDLSLDPVLGDEVEFAADLDVPDPEFEDWIRDRRQEFARLIAQDVAQKPTVPNMPSPSLVVLPPRCEDVHASTAAEILTSDIATQIARVGNATIELDPTHGGARERLAVLVKSARLGETVRYQVQLIEMATRRVVWSGQCDGPPRGLVGQSDAFSNLVAKASWAAIEHFGRAETAAPLVDGRWPYQIFCQFPFHNDAKLGQLDHWLSNHRCEDMSPLQLAWRARLRLVSTLERKGCVAASREEAEDYAQRALALDPGNPMITAIAAEVALHLHDQPFVAGELARAGVELDPGNPFAAAIYAQTLVRCDRAQEGLNAALRALGAASRHQNKGWWHAICAATAIRANKIDLARVHAEMAHFLAPNFHPPLRFLCALRFNAGDEAGTVTAIERLKALEPDFSLQRMADGDYPVASLRNTPLMAVTQSGLH